MQTVKENKYIQFLLNLYKGRLNRRNFIIGWAIFFMLIAMVSMMVYGNQPQNNKMPTVSPEQTVLMVISFIIFYYYVLSLYARRLHDIGLSGWFAVVTFIPYVNVLFLLAMAAIPGKKEDNKYGKKPHKDVKFPNDILNLPEKTK